jgi:plasmid maintenance system antidote protein VapI
VTGAHVPTFDPEPVLASYHGKSNTETAELLGVTRETIARWRNGHHGLTVWRADELAVKKLGTHPALLWPDWFGS